MYYGVNGYYDDVNEYLDAVRMGWEPCGDAKKNVFYSSDPCYSCPYGFKYCYGNCNRYRRGY